jgi:diguanylate cyclase (GGDEF)-like protein
MTGVLFIDLDGFKTINDRYGHDLGDLVLQEVAARLTRCLRECDTISRRGGDEFTAIVTDIGRPEDCAQVAQTIIEQLARPIVLEGQTLSIGGSIGISIYPSDGGDASLLLSRADEAMYRAKQAGRGRYCFYAAARTQTG